MKTLTIIKRITFTIGLILLIAMVLKSEYFNSIYGIFIGMVVMWIALWRLKKIRKRSKVKPEDRELYRALKLMLKDYRSITKKTLGLCNEVTRLYDNNKISGPIAEVLLWLIKKNNPGVESEHWPFYWKRGDKYPRIEWIKKQIEQLKKKVR